MCVRERNPQLVLLLRFLLLLALTALLGLVGLRLGRNNAAPSVAPLGALSPASGKPGPAAAPAPGGTLPPVMQPQKLAPPTPGPSSAASPLPAGRAASSAPTPAAAPSASARPQATPKAHATPDTGLPAGVQYARTDDPVKIESVGLSSDVVHGGDVVRGEVTTSSNVAALTARIGAYQVSVPKVAPGKFSLDVTVPHLFFPGHHHVDVIVTAFGSAGESDSRSVPVEVYF